MNTFDYIIIGAGSAGCVLANKLGQNTSLSILVIEAGPRDRDLMIHVPAGVYRVWRDPKYNWNYHSDPEDGLDQRQVFTPRGKVVGGSSSINSMVYMRGHPRDFDAWESECGLSGWNYAQCLPYFKAGETYTGGADAYRGGEGYLGTTRGNYDNPLYDAFIEAGGQAGQGLSDDLNGHNPEGVTRFDATKRNGRRCSAAVAHLGPALKRGNVQLVTRAQVQNVVIEDGRATGVVFTHRGKEHTAHAGREVILSGGAINSPKLLMLSGIGPADHLAEFDIEAHADLPGVGANLQDHASIILQFESLKRFPVHRVDAPWRKALAGAQWVFTRDGVAASNIWEAGGLVRSNDQVDYPNIQYHFGPVGFEYSGNKIALSQGFSIHIDLLRPQSRGAVRLTSADPSVDPSIRFNYLTQHDDLQQLIEGVGKIRDLVSQSAFDGLAGRELVPGADIKSERDIARWIKSASETDFHPSGTCQMGHGPDAVVDDQMRVHGIDGLRVVDASVMPRITSANLNAPVQMIAARAADMILGKAPLAPETPGFAFET